MINKWLLLMGSAGFIASISQIMLKKSAMNRYSSRWKEYLNFLVIGAYMLLAISMLFNVIAYRGVTYQTGIVMGALPYIYVIVWERIFFRQKLNLKKIAGAALIIFGICIYAL